MRELSISQRDHSEINQYLFVAYKSVQYATDKKD